MVKVSVTSGQDTPERRRNVIAPLVLTDLAGMQEGQDLDFKREVEMDKPERKARLVDDVVAFLNRGAGRIVIGVVEKHGRFDSLRPMSGDADMASLALQTMLQEKISPVPIDIQVVPVHLEQGFILDVRIPSHRGGPFVNLFTGGYLVRSGARNLPIDPGALRSRFIDDLTWMGRLDELVAAEDTRIAEAGRMVTGQVLRIGILPREHFDYTREPFEQGDRVRYPGPNFHEHYQQWFKVCEDGHEAWSGDMAGRGIERLFIRDDWFVHAHIGFAIGVTPGEGRLGLYEFNQAFKAYMAALATFLSDQKIEGPYAVTLALRSLDETEPMKVFFPRTASVRTLRPRFVEAIDDPQLLADFERRVKQATVWG